MPTQIRRFHKCALGAVFGLLTLAVLTPGDAAAQRHGGHVHGADEAEDEFYEEYQRPRWELGGGVSILSPQGDFSSFVNDGYGVSLNATVGLEPNNALAMRFEGGYINYGSERFGVPVFPGTGRILANLTTRNNIAYAGLGPVVQMPYGPIRPYVNGFVGVSYFFTESSVGGGHSYDYGGFGRTLNFDDASLAYGLGGGVSFRLSKGRSPVFLKLDGQYRRHGQTEYLTEGGILDDGFGGATVSPILSDVDFLLFNVGVSIGLR